MSLSNYPSTLEVLYWEIGATSGLIVTKTITCKCPTRRFRVTRDVLKVVRGNQLRNKLSRMNVDNLEPWFQCPKTAWHVGSTRPCTASWRIYVLHESISLIVIRSIRLLGKGYTSTEDQFEDNVSEWNSLSWQGPSLIVVSLVQILQTTVLTTAYV